MSGAPLYAPICYERKQSSMYLNYGTENDWVKENESASYKRPQRKFINNYKEFGHKTEISFLNHISKEPLKEKTIILNYLKGFPNYAIRCCTLNDFVEEKIYSPSVYLHFDGEYIWNDEETYHFEKYNMELNPDFIKKVMDTQKERESGKDL